MAIRVDADRPRDLSLFRTSEATTLTPSQQAEAPPGLDLRGRDWVDWNGSAELAKLGAGSGSASSGATRAFGGIGAPGATRSNLLGAPPATGGGGKGGGTTGIGAKATTAATPSGTPMTQAEVTKEYKAGGKTDLTSAGSLKALNDEVAKHGDGKPVTKAEVEDIIAKSDIKLLSQKDYETLKTATGGSRDNPATAVPSGSREKLATDGAYRLAKRWKLEKQQSDAEPTKEEVEAARKELERIDPGAFAKPPKDAVYVNAKYAKQGYQGDPRVTKVATHELTHLVLFRHGVPAESEGHDVHHEFTGSVGWNAKHGTTGKIIPGETDNWSTKPGDGLPPPPAKKTP